MADFLVEHGEDRDDLNVFASRRGNWEVMVRAAFHSKTLVNPLAPGAPVAHTVHAPSGEIACRSGGPRTATAARATPSSSSAGERYGTGSSRDWAAKGPRLLGVRAVLALSFERIHRSNLIGMGILPLRLASDSGPDALQLAPGDRIEVDAPAASLQPRVRVPVRVLRSNGTAMKVQAIAAVETEFEVALLRAGGVIPSILGRFLSTGA